ncbi:MULTISPECIES: metallophosphoesterase [Agrobacterium]|uniref:Calcineurin-like phosphoesterase domain-containing protein n=2 Tax=Agrobacterium tumefaciens complex TaxID=1183400 RepID=A0AAE6BJB5_AGRTU|nr:MULTISPECIES: metallophosphoesterase [Agrobacterium]ASK40730.1 hypothetical protein [Agrobacterium genomosp. 6]ASK41493.1 hypothetical protein [Agrobacterium genomosp. 6]QCL77475.1 hypothetical protein CFBP5499_28880 [Agrobacterium tumefaciens]QCL82963.1 hypothetical protein CFBP5877_28045 [Agrobacterium tumefaciens]CUX71680.1 hypothetical protein AGR6A_pTi0221 [Agrobacterium sp. NCPPB 925]
MRADVLNKENVLETARQIRQHLAASLPARQGRRRAIDDETAEIEIVVDEIDASLASHGENKSPKRRGFQPLGDGEHPPSAFMSRDAILSNVQSALEVVLDNPETGGKPPATEGAREPTDTNEVPARDRRSRRVFDKFSVTDIGWISSLVATGVTKFRSPRDFNPLPAATVALPSKCRVIMVGDWGSGLPRAQSVAREMRKFVEDAKDSGLACHVVHLGDVYYSGWEYEYKQRFLPYWPVLPSEKDRFGSWCLNGNHDMYSGGYGYFDYLLADPRFARQEKSSFFRIATPKWQILGLDTAWDDDGLKDPQAAWVESMNSDGARRTMILSHHQMFSAREPGDVGKVMRQKLSRTLEAGAIDAAIWGHEHRCMVFAPHNNVQYARLIGHGGVPVYADKGEPPPPAVFQTSRTISTNPLEHWALMGFAVFDFDDAEVNVLYVDENGQIDKRETLR